jgi:hypothetical protein
MRFLDAKRYVKELNRQRFTGHSDLRLITLEELCSLVESRKRNGDLYIDPVFDSRQHWCWSADMLWPDSAWYVHFHGGGVSWRLLNNASYVRAVRS